MKILSYGALSLMGFACVAMPLAGAHAEESWSFPVEVWDPPFNMDSPRSKLDYTPVEKAAGRPLGNNANRSSIDRSCSRPSMWRSERSSTR